MIPFDFEYYRPETIDECTKLYSHLKSQGNKVMYYSGGTEIISMARTNNVYADAIIDLKGISECNVHELKDGKLIIGSTVTLTQIAETNLFPLLSSTVQRIADHTIQGKITLGGNLAGSIIYREAVLPLLVSNSKITIVSSGEKKQFILKDAFNKRIKLADGEFILNITIDSHFLSLPYWHAKRTKSDKIDYPLITIAALKDNDRINIAFSGVCNYPFRSTVIENYLNNSTLHINTKVNNAVDNIPGSILNDLSGSADFRKFILQKMLTEVISKLEE